MNLSRHCKLILYILYAVIAASCSTTKVIPEGESRLKSNRIIIENSKSYPASELQPYIKQKPNSSFIEFDNTLVMSALKKAEDRNTVIVRFYNPTEKEVSSMINLMKTPKCAYITNMNEERIKELDLSKPIAVAKQKIITIEMEF